MKSLTVPFHGIDARRVNERLLDLSAREIVEWASHMFGDGLVMSTSFGIQSAVMLHLVTQVTPGIPVIWVDTGYLPSETYRFADQLTSRLGLDLHIYRSPISPVEMVTQYGKLWESNNAGDFDLYDQIRKVEPMNRALRQLGATAWLSGLRREQTEFREKLSPLTFDGTHYKVLPILSWTSQDVYEYLSAHDLPYHPLFDQGYFTVGDWHSSRPLNADDTHERDTRFGGLKQECGIHLPQDVPQRLAAVAA